MNVLESTFRKIERFVRNMAYDRHIYMLSLDSEETVLARNPHKYVSYAIHDKSDPADAVFAAALSAIPIYALSGEDRTREEVLFAVLSGLNLSPFALGSGRMAAPVPQDIEGEIQARIARLQQLFAREFHVDLACSPAPADYVTLLNSRIGEARQYYVEEHGAWIQTFMNTLGDDISRDSFATFLRQRIKAHVFRGVETCYPVMPPVRTAGWRKQREAATYDFPILEGCREDVRQFFYRDTFVYEQYAIAGVVEARPGDVVIDAGAFIGDTACYFSRKVGESGKVFAFEAVPESACFARKNMQLNHCENVEIVPMALSDRKSTFSIALNAHSNSGASLVPVRSTDSSLISVESTTLDDFCTNTGLDIDFIKSDIEGSEMQLLHGAKRIIANQSPVCAIALYHKKDDFWQIPEFLASLCPDYTFWFRCEAEPVLFAKRNQ